MADHIFDRRTALKATGGLLSLACASGIATAKGNNYANGNGIGAFLNEEAEFKDPPLWSSGIADKTGQSTVDVTVGAMTSVDIPDPNAPDEAPVAFAPQAVKVSPDTEVTWTWLTDHHSVASYEGAGYGGLFHEHGHLDYTFTYKFTDVGNYLYFCIPHGTPFPIDLGSPVGEVENLLGMRGAVIVSDE